MDFFGLDAQPLVAESGLQRLVAKIKVRHSFMVIIVLVVVVGH
jgi:hypothetical protein